MSDWTKRANLALLSVGICLMLANLWGVGEVHSLVSERPRLSGQVVTTRGVSTERYINESLEAWRTRHEEALSVFGEQ